jgi:hypothetical protein
MNYEKNQSLNLDLENVKQLKYKDCKVKTPSSGVSKSPTP